MTAKLIDVHCHLNHTKYDEDRFEVAKEAEQSGVEFVVVNGLNPVTNDIAVEMASKSKNVLAAAGIYPIDAINHILPEDFEINVKKFDVDQEVSRINRWAAEQKVAAIGECGLDGYWVGESTYPEQERIFRALIEVAKSNELPIIIHSRKLEKRCFEILIEHQYNRANFHCYSGKSKLAIRHAEEHGFKFSIPANARRSESFQKLLKNLPSTSILTETDSPFLSPIRGERNHPKNVSDTVKFLSELREISFEEARDLVWQNFHDFMFKK